MQYDFYSWQSLSLSFMHYLPCDPNQAPLGFEPGSPDWEVDDLPTKLSMGTGIRVLKGEHRVDTDEYVSYNVKTVPVGVIGLVLGPGVTGGSVGVMRVVLPIYQNGKRFNY